MLIRPRGEGGLGLSQELNPGDILAGGDSMSAGAISTAGAGTWTGAAIATGLIYRTGPVAGYIDTVDSAWNILQALSGNAGGGAVNVMPGSTFRLLFINTVAFAMTNALTAGSGMIADSPSQSLNAVASLWREYMFTIVNNTPPQTLPCGTTNASAAVTFNLQPGQVALPQGLITPGMVVGGTGITAGTTVIGITNGLGGITGVTLSANATATNASSALTFAPQIRMAALRSGTIL